MKNLPDNQKGNLFVSFSKKQPDLFFSGGGTLGILSETGNRHVAGFECEPTGELVLALMSNNGTSHKATSRPTKTIGTTSISLQELINADSNLSMEKWFELNTNTQNLGSAPICLRVAVSSTVPVPAPLLLNMSRSNPLSLRTCFFPLGGEGHQVGSWTRFEDDNGKEVISLHIRYVLLIQTSRTFSCIPVT